MKINAPGIWRGAPLVVKEFRLLLNLRALSYLTLDLCNTYPRLHEAIQEVIAHIAVPSRGRGIHQTYNNVIARFKRTLHVFRLSETFHKQVNIIIKQIYD